MDGGRPQNVQDQFLAIGALRRHTDQRQIRSEYETDSLMGD